MRSKETLKIPFNISEEHRNQLIIIQKQGGNCKGILCGKCIFYTNEHCSVKLSSNEEVSELINELLIAEKINLI